MTAVLAVAWSHDIGGSLKEGFFMFWVTLWPLVLGFGLSGAVQAFVPKSAMQRALGNHRPAAVLRATGFGMASSSCSYAATALARSMIAKGADFVSAMAFMFASTNLVIELGIVLVVLLGWQFAVAEFVGGSIMIVLLVLTSGLALAGVAKTRRNRADGTVSDESVSSQSARSNAAEAVQSESSPSRPQPIRINLRSLDRWSAAARFTVSDVRMLWRELLVGYVVAGFLTVLVPTHVWNDVFIHGHGFWTSLENVVVGPFVAIISFVCSIGNVPLAASLWSGGISFGGVISFLFADLITFPLLMIYRKQYGTRLALRMLVWFWGVMALSGLAVEGLARALGLVPSHRTATVVATNWSWNYTTYLNLLFLAVIAVVYLLSRRANRSKDETSSTDPVCGMQVEPGAGVALQTDGGELWFCSERCRDRFIAKRAGALVAGGP